MHIDTSYKDLFRYDITMNDRDLAIQMAPPGKPQTMGIQDDLTK